MKDISWQKLFWLYIIVVFTLEVILASFFSLQQGIIEIFPYLYILPIILLARNYPRFAVYFTLILGWIYLALVYFFMPFEIRAFAASVAWFYIFVTIGVVIASVTESGQQDKKFREMFDNSLAGIFTIDSGTGTFLQLNGRTASLLGYAPGELEGKNISAVWRDGAEADAFLKRSPADACPLPAEVAFRRKDGLTVWVLLTASPIGPSRMVFSIIDISEKKEIRDSLIESELRYHTLFDRATDAILIHDRDGTILHANDTAAELSGYPVKKLAELRLEDLGLVPPGGLPARGDAELVSRGSHLFESMLMTKNGTPRPVEINCKTIEFNKRPAILSTIRDISERRRAQAALIELGTRYRIIGDLIPYGVWACDASGRFTYLSDSFLALLGTTLAECKKNGWMHLLPPEDYDRIIADWQRCIRSGSFWSCEYRIVDRTGKTVVVLSRGAPHRDQTGKITSWVGIHVDITDRKRFEEKL